VFVRRAPSLAGDGGIDGALGRKVAKHHVDLPLDHGTMFSSEGCKRRVEEKASNPLRDLFNAALGGGKVERANVG